MTPLGHYLIRPPRYGIGAAAVPHRADLPTYLRITDIDEFGRFRPDPVVSVDSQLSHNYLLQDGDLVIARTGASVGKSYRYRPADGELVFAGFLVAIRPDHERLDPRYLAYFLQSKRYWDWIASESMRSGQPGVNAQQIARLGLEVPAIDEQRAIADMLGAADRLIDSLERLIAKKRDIKQGLIQELLSGRTRLPGYAGPWKDCSAGDIGSFKGGSGFPTRYQGKRSGTYPFFKVSDMNSTGNELFMSTANNYISDDVQRQMGANVMPGGAIVFAKVGAAVFLERKRILTTPSCIDNNMAAFMVDETQADVRFVHYALTNFPMASLVATGALPSLNGRQMRSIPLAIPAELDEQRAIARVIDDADAEIAALERRLASARDIKTGMMQDLLTGRTRLTMEVAS